MHNIIIPRYANLICSELGHDSPQHAGPRFSTYSDVQYKFNSNGFRTYDLSQLDSDCVLVFGDSFTLGLGVNSQDRFSNLMEKQLGLPVFNISLNGASNDWIARRVQDLLQIVKPQAVVIHYTFSHRREHKDSTWHDDERTLCDVTHSDHDNYLNWKTNSELITSACHSCILVHSFITNWHITQIDYDSIPGTVLLPQQLLDVARDGFHYGVKTHSHLATCLTSLLADGLHLSHGS